MDDKAKALMARFDKMATFRKPFEIQWQEIVDYVIPNKNDFTIIRYKGSRRNFAIYDSTAPKALERFASALQGFITNPADRWFNLITVREEYMKMYEVRAWLQYVENHMFDIFESPKSKFYAQSHEGYLDIGAFGTFIMYSEKQPGKATKFKTFQLSECFLVENSDSEIDTVFRKFKFTVRQALQKFGEDSGGGKFKEMAAKGEYEKEINILHCVYPRENYNPDLYDALNMPIASVYIWIEESMILSEGGYREFPYQVARWYTLTGEVYGRSVCMTMMPDIKMVNQMKKTLLKGLQKVVDPPLQVPDDGFMAPINLAPAALNYYRAGTNDRIEPIETKAQIQVGQQGIQDIQNSIREGFYNDLTQEDKSVEMTATESTQRDEARMRLMAPNLGRLHVEWLGPLIERVFNMELRAGSFPPPPAVLQGQRLKVQYCSPLARAQKMMQVQNVTRMFETLVPFSQVKPEVLDRFSGDGLSQFIAEMYNTPEDVLVTDEELQQIKDSRAQQQQLATGLQAAEQGSKALANLGNALPNLQAANGTVPNAS